MKDHLEDLIQNDGSNAGNEIEVVSPASEGPTFEVPSDDGGAALDCQAAPQAVESHDATIERLAKLSERDYEMVRREEAIRLKARVPFLDKEVKAKRLTVSNQECPVATVDPSEPNSGPGPEVVATDEASVEIAAEESSDPIVDAINGAEEIADPLDRLVEKAVADAGAPFKPEVLVALAKKKKNDRSGFETLRRALKDVGCRVTALDEAIAEESGDAGGRGPTQSDTLIDLAQVADLFHTSDRTGYADVVIDGHRQTWPIRSEGFKRWLTRRFFDETGSAPSSEAMQAALNFITANADFGRPERTVHVRVGGLDGRIYIDLGDETWRAVEIDGTGWRVIDNPPVRFRRAEGVLPLPAPVPGGRIDALLTFLNVRTDADFVLVVAWALAVLRDHGPYPVLVLSGEQGSAKSTFSKILRALLDPNTAGLRTLPRDDRDLFIAANNGHMLVFDNVSGLPAWISDTLCRLATGGGFAARRLYSDQSETLFNVMRPIILNGIEELVTRADLANRAVFLELKPIPEANRRPEAELWAAFEAERPKLFGVLLDAMVEGIKRLPETRVAKLPRMADFALWATACETALWPAGTFDSAYRDNLDEAVHDLIDADPVAAGIRELVSMQTERTGRTQNATTLLGALEQIVGEKGTRSKRWPEDARALSARLSRIAPNLRKIGIEIERTRVGKGRDRMITLINTAFDSESLGNFASASSASSAPWEEAGTAEAISLDLEMDGDGEEPDYPEHFGAKESRYDAGDVFPFQLSEDQ